ncbi:MAG: hypothetical protein LC799_14805, partial [Actinobacteria bacterium]|nr:hypothetical protein [Actinomycetota bacterium]
MDDSEALPVPEAVSHLWKCVRKALAANEDPPPRRIERLATTADRELAASTIEGWFQTWSIVPTWEKFEALIKALAAEHDEDWRTLHGAALTANRAHKRQERQRKKLSRLAESTSPDSKPTDSQADPLSPDDPGSTATRTHVGGPPTEQTSFGSSSAPATAVPAAVQGCRLYGDLHLYPPADDPAAETGSVPRQLPMDVAHFTGRSDELAQLDALLTHEDTAQPSAMVISAIAGMAG